MSHEYQIPNLVLDETDKQILTILHEEGRISYTDLGKRVDLSRVAVQARINQLLFLHLISQRLLHAVRLQQFEQPRA